MRVPHGVIHLVQPLFGRHRLEGAAVIGPTWIEYRVPPGSLPSLPLDEGSTEVGILRGDLLLIPLSNITMIVIEDDAGEESEIAPGDEAPQTRKGG